MNDKAIEIILDILDFLQVLISDNTKSCQNICVWITLERSALAKTNLRIFGDIEDFFKE
jgi:hypothetical protein